MPVIKDSFYVAVMLYVLKDRIMNKGMCMSDLNIAVYAEGCMYPDDCEGLQPVDETIAQLQVSGFTTLILGLFHIGRNYSIDPPQQMGDLYFNNQLIFSSGRYVGDPAWLGQVKSALGGSVDQVGASIGGGGVMDFQTLEKIFHDNGSTFAGTNLERNVRALRDALPSVGFIDMDCEDVYDSPSFVAFCRLLAELGFGLTFCPYMLQPFWVQALAALQQTHPGSVRWWNLQCYDGGFGNDPARWASAIKAAMPGFATDKYILAGDWTDAGTSGVKELMAAQRQKACVGGGFIWTLDRIIETAIADGVPPQVAMTGYVNAIETGLHGKSAQPMRVR